MGVVYLAERSGLPDRVALKLIHPGFTGDDSFRKRFRREVATSRTVRGHYIAAVVDADTEGDPAWLATEYVPGPTLGAFVDAVGALPDDQAIALAAGLLEGLASVHAAGVTHRDLKPSNVLLTSDGPVIIDFGIASAADGTSLTATGISVGSAGWMAPEQVLGRPVGPPADVFAWGALTAYASTGRPPFGSGRADALAYRIAHEEPNLDGVPSDLARVVVAALAKEPLDRPDLASLRRLLAGGDATQVAGIAAGWDTRTVLATPTMIAPIVARSSGTTAPRRRAHLLKVAAGVVGAVLTLGAVGVYVQSLEGATAASSADSSTEVPTTAAATTTTAEALTTTTEPPPPTTTTTAPATLQLVGDTDPNPDHWRPSDYEEGYASSTRVHETWTQVYEYPMTMNGCASRQTRVEWRSIGSPVYSGVGEYSSEHEGIDMEVTHNAGPSMTGSIWLNSCQQPAFRAQPGNGLSDLAIEVSIWYPAAG